MTQRSSGQGRPDDWSNGYGARDHPYGAGTPGSYGPVTAGGYHAGDSRIDELFQRDADPFGSGATDAYHGGVGNGGMGNGYHAPAAGSGAPTATLRAGARQHAGHAGGFIGALFDFSFSSFVTPRVVRVLYVLIVIGTIVGAAAFTIAMFRVSAALGILTLAVAAPLYVLIVLAIYRVILEFFMVVFRMADDIKALRERGDIR